MKRNVCVVIGISCEGCNSLGVRVFDHTPSQSEINSVDEKMGGMYCIHTYQAECEVNGDTQELECE